VISQVLIVSIKMVIFWVVASYSLTVLKEAGSTSEISVNFYQTTW
jgi:hypothetical protein